MKDRIDFILSQVQELASAWALFEEWKSKVRDSVAVLSSVPAQEPEEIEHLRSYSL